MNELQPALNQGLPSSVARTIRSEKPASTTDDTPKTKATGAYDARGRLSYKTSSPTKAGKPAAPNAGRKALISPPRELLSARQAAKTSRGCTVMSVG